VAYMIPVLVIVLAQAAQPAVAPIDESGVD
jgi:hypothetical protein